MKAPKFVLCVCRESFSNPRVGFFILRIGSKNTAKHCDLARFGFFVQPRDALDVIKLVAKQVEADNAKLAKLDREPHVGRAKN
jgi:hypothetical protein